MPFEVYVGNYPTTFVEDDILDLFQVFEGAELKRFHKFKKKCYSILRCVDEDQVIEVVKTMHDIDVCGRNLIVRSCDNSLQTRIEESLSKRGILSLHPRNRCDYSSSYSVTGNNSCFIPAGDFASRPSPFQELIYKNKIPYQNKEDVKIFDNDDPDNHTSYQTCVFPNTGSYIVLPDLRPKDIQHVVDSKNVPDSIFNNLSQPNFKNFPDPKPQSLPSAVLKSLPNSIPDPSSNNLPDFSPKNILSVIKKLPNHTLKHLSTSVSNSSNLNFDSKHVKHIPDLKGTASSSKNHHVSKSKDLSKSGSNSVFPTPSSSDSGSGGLSVPSSDGLLPISGSNGLLPVHGSNGLLPLPSSNGLLPLPSSNGLLPTPSSNGFLPIPSSNGLLPIHGSNGLLPDPPNRFRALTKQGYGVMQSTPICNYSSNYCDLEIPLQQQSEQLNDVSSNSYREKNLGMRVQNTNTSRSYIMNVHPVQTQNLFMKHVA
ncbi:uncharacterized protein TNCV_3502301 [Trichonephila clavipes]|uniref:RRM domain-containing protein n=1 Tax=Trichonephila clavipes TaxID=2585209 RepID=A0A8X6VC02_TRICX|nr:uncharacterized protein TNCV_3502301 [Trichonephila clavipes]